MLKVLVQEWLQRHGPFDAVVDGANLGLANQRTFNFGQVMRMQRPRKQKTSDLSLDIVFFLFFFFEEVFGYC